MHKYFHTKGSNTERQTIELYLQIKYNRNSGESFIVLTLVTERGMQFER